MSFCKREETFKVSKSFDKDRADVLAASDLGSYFEQEKLIHKTRKNKVDGRTRLLALAGRKLKTKTKTNLQNQTHKSRGKSWPVEQLLPAIACKKISRNQLPRFSHFSNHELFGAFAVRSCNFLICTRTCPFIYENAFYLSSASFNLFR